MTMINRSSGSPWRKRSGDISASSSLVITTKDLSKFRSLDIFITAHNVTQDKTKHLQFSVVQEGGSLKSSVYGRLGTLKIAVDEAIVASNIEVTITNNETFDVVYEIAELVMGG